MEYFRILDTDVIASLQIECELPVNLTGVPVAECDPIRFISTTFHTMCPVERKLILLHTSVIKKDAKTEKEAILEWLELIRNQKTTIIMGWYLFGFDYIYIEERAKQLGILDAFRNFGTFKYNHAGSQLRELATATGREWRIKFDYGSCLQLIDLMPYVEFLSGIEGKLDKLAKFFDLEIPQFPGFQHDQLLEDYSLKICALQMDLFWRVYKMYKKYKKYRNQRQFFEKKLYKGPLPELNPELIKSFLSEI